MFFADPVAAFANIRSATRPGGRLVFACWQPLAANQWMLVPGAALAEHLPPPDPGPGDGPGMFAFADPDRLRPILAAAGWRDIEITSEHASILVGGGGSVDDAVEFLRTATHGPDHARRSRRRHGGPRARVAAGRAHPVRRRRRRAPGRRGMAGPGRGAVTRRPGRRLALRNHQRLPRRFRHRDHPARRGGRPGHVALGTDLDGNYRPVLTSYDQLDDLASLLRDRGLPSAHVQGILGGNALNLLNSIRATRNPGQVAGGTR